MKNNKIKDMLNNIEVSKELDDKILSKTVYKKQHLILQKSIIIISVIIIIGTTGFGIAHADDIVQKIKSLFVTYTYTSSDENTKLIITELNVTNKKEINYDANLKPAFYSGEEYYIALDKLEKELDTKFLRPDGFNNKKEVRIGRMEKNENKIGRCGFSYDYIYKNKKEKIYMSAQFMTKYYNNDSFGSIEGVEWHEKEYGIDAKHYKKEEKNDILNTNIYYYAAYDFTNGEKGVGGLNASFIYDDVLYKLYGINTDKTKLLEIINSLHY